MELVTVKGGVRTECSHLWLVTAAKRAEERDKFKEEGKPETEAIHNGYQRKDVGLLA